MTRCTSRKGETKKRWPNREAAQFVADWVKLKGGDPQSTYLCDQCGGWHTTTDRDEPSSSVDLPA